MNSSTDPIFQVLEQYLNFIPFDELHEYTFASEESGRGRSTKMKDIRNVIGASLWCDRY